MGKDMDHPPVASPTTAEQAVPLLDVTRALFDVPQKTLVHLGHAKRWEQDPTLSEFTSQSQDLPLGALLHAAPPTSALRQHIQTPHCLDTKPDFAAFPCG